MEEGLADPLSLAKDASLIKDAQSEYGKMDILICGTCHAVFHFVEEYNTHKNNKCQDSNLSQQCENEDRALTWAFCLWKNREVKDPSMGMWQMYQKWCKLPQEDKDLWIAGGQTILSLNKIRVAKMQEVKFKVKREEEKDPLAFTDNDVNTLDDKDSKISLNKQAASKSPKHNDLLSSGNDAPKDELKEYVVESIVGKRFNSKRKTWEYKVKWENFDESQCSWEPMEHLGGCRALINVFEQKIKLDKERKKLAEQAKTTKVKMEVKTDDESVDFGIGRRPQRSSKQKALNQVKRWLGEGGSDNEDSKDSRKRLHLEDDSDDMSFEKRMKMEEESDDSVDEEEEEDEKPKKSSLLKHNTSNGLAGKKLPNNVLIPDAQGIVRINQKQLPSLSSGVYIMSKTAGIIKLDSQTSKIAASGGQAVVKVAPRIGQTHIRIVKKDGATASRVIQMGQKSKMSPAGTPRSMVSHKVSKLVRNPTSRINKIDEKKSQATASLETDDAKEPESAADDDSDCGLPELEFPAEIIPPEPEEPPGEFTLDPSTGKIAGVEYPEIEPEPETATEENKENAESALDNIVKLAAADITEADLKPDLSENVTEGNTAHVATPIANLEGKKPETLPMRVKKEVGPMSKVQQKFMISPNIRTSNILERTLQNPRTVVKSPQGYTRQIYAKSPQRIINSAMTPKLTSPLVRTVVRSTYAAKPKSVFPKQRIYMSSPSSKLNENIIRQPYSQKANATKRVGNIGGTTIYKRSSQQNKMLATYPKVVQRTNVVRKPVPTVRTVVQKSPKPVINMPSLMDDDLPVQPIADNVQMIQKVETAQEATEAASVAATTASNTSDEIASFAALSDGEAPIFITGDDGTVYQVAGQNEQGQTILITQGPDGQQQCLLVTSETAGPDDVQESQEDGTSHITAAMIEGTELAAQQTEGMEDNSGMEEASVQEPLTIKTEPETQSEVVAQFVKAVPPSPGGTPKVMVMLPDGNLVVTPVTAEEYASWQELEK